MARLRKLAAAALAVCYALPSARGLELPRVAFENCGSTVTSVRLSATAAGCAVAATNTNAHAPAPHPQQHPKPASMQPLSLRPIDRVQSDASNTFSWIPIPIRKEEALQKPHAMHQ
jgi:hypothetical protein